MKRRQILSGLIVPILLVSAIIDVKGQDCELTGRLERQHFISAFRHSYLDIFNENNRNNLVAEAQRIYRATDIRVVRNEKEGCKARAKESKSRCDKCVRRMAWRAPSEWFGNRRRRRTANQRRFTQILRKRACDYSQACNKPVKHKLPKPLILSTDENDPTLRTSLKIALVADNDGVRVSYSIWLDDMISNGFSSSIADYARKSPISDKRFFQCVENGMKRDIYDASVGRDVAMIDWIGRQVENSCIVEEQLEQPCVEHLVANSVCESMNNSNCSPPGQTLISGCNSS